MCEADITIIGAGVIGLAIAGEVAGENRNVFVLERHSSFGQEISSRNSEVIHTGVYYPQGSLKAKTCIKGNRLLYEICESNRIPHEKIGKLIVAVQEEEVSQLESLLEQGKDNGLGDLRLIDSRELRIMEPNVFGLAALYLPSAGIIDSHQLMKCFIYEAESKGATIIYNCEVTGIDKKAGSYKVTTKEYSRGTFKFGTRILINCAGLDSDGIAGMVGINVQKSRYMLHFCKGEYFRLNAGKNNSVKRLIYPVPEMERGGLGIHMTLDLAGNMRLGPDAKYLPVRQKDYSVDDSNRHIFYREAKRLFPLIKEDDLCPDMAGIRPKLQKPGERFRDFVIHEESEKGFEGFINLIGIESPGLTASVAIAKYVKKMVDERLN